MNQVLHLFQLQKIDTQLDRISNRLREIVAILQNDQSVQEAENKLKKARQEHFQAHQALHIAEDEVLNQRIKIETSESALYSGKIKNPKELQDIQNEIVSLKKFLGVLEDQQLESMFIFEAAENNQKTSEDNLVKVQIEQASRLAGLLGEKNQLEHQQERLNTERQACQNQILPESLAIYQKLREQKRGLAISVVEDGACKACGSSLRPAELQSARSPHNIIYCSSCGRIVYMG